MTRGGPESGQQGELAERLGWPAAAVEIWPLAKIRMRKGNPNTHTLEQIEQIGAAMDEWGWTMPMLVDETGELIAGEGRFRAARLKGWAEGPVLIARGWSEEKKRAYVIADNQLGRNSVWDQKLLRAELRSLSVAEFDMKLIGITDDDMQKMLFDPKAEPGEATEPEDVHMVRCPTCKGLRRKVEGKT